MVRKHSQQRDSIMTFLASRKDHPTADVVYDHVRTTLPNISLGTVYRNLNLLAEQDEIQKLQMGDGTIHFDADTSRHYHMVCTSCGSVIDLTMRNIDSINAIAAENFDGMIAGHQTYFYGLCSHCLSASTTKTK